MDSTTRWSRRSRAGWWVATALIGLLAAGCGGDEVVEQRSADPADAATIDTSIDPGSADDGYVGAVADVTDLACEQQDGGWQASGLVTNPTDGAVDYRIYVSFVGEDGETRGLIQVDVADVAAGAEEPWETDMGLEDEDLRCLLRVERVGGPAGTETTSEDA